MQHGCNEAGLEIVARQDFSDVTFLLEVSHPMLARAARPGQFVIVMPHAEVERIPLTIADYDRERGTVTLVIQAAGKSASPFCGRDPVLPVWSGIQADPAVAEQQAKTGGEFLPAPKSAGA